MTNGEKLCEVFPNNRWVRLARTVQFCINPMTINQQLIVVDRDFWDAEYKEPTMNDSSELEKNSKKLEKDCGESDCISRAEALDCLKVTELKKFDWIIDAREKISNLLPITPQPRKGHWIGKGYFITCSCCNEMSYPFDYGGYGSIYHDYCPNCGAKMEEGEEE